MRIPFASPGYQLFMLALCTYAVLGLAVQAAVHVDPGAKTILDYADHAICALFFIDFIVNLVRAENRWKYFVTWGWMDLLSSIPMIDVARWGRAARILRIFRLVRGIRATKLLIELVVKQRRRNGLLAATLMALLLVIFSSIAVLHFETKAPDGNIKTPENALWWAWATITTVGYGDHYPVTSAGRLIAALLMCGGVGLFGVFSGVLASWFIGAEHFDVGTELRAMREEVKALRSAVQSASPTRAQGATALPADNAASSDEGP